MTKKKPGFVESSDSVLELETNAVPESFTNGFCTIVYKRNIALSGLLVCRLIKSLSEVLSSKLSRSPSKLRFSVEFFIFRTLFQPKTLSVHIPASFLDFNFKETYLKVRRLSSIKKWLFWKLQNNFELLILKNRIEDRRFNFAKSFVALNAPSACS